MQLQPDEPEVKKCHLHKKANKACKFCKAYILWAEQQEKKKEEAKNEILEKIKSSGSESQSFAPTDKCPVPNFSRFPRVLAEKIMGTENYFAVTNVTLVEDVSRILLRSDCCDIEHNWSKSKIDRQPTSFIMAVYRLLQIQINEKDLSIMLKHDSHWMRCAAFLYVRLGFHCDRYWECLGGALLDEEEFIPFKGKGVDAGNTMTVGEYVEDLFMKVEYGESDAKEGRITLPRVPELAKQKLVKRICLLRLCRQRYYANLEVVDRYIDAGVEVEVCDDDGEWRTCLTKEPAAKSKERRSMSVLVLHPDGKEEYVSLGKVIAPSENSSASDLTRDRGETSDELFEKHKEQEKGNALARGKEYSKPFVHSVCIRGVRHVVENKRARTDGHESDDDLEDDLGARSVKYQKVEAEKLATMAEKAAIEAKYCAKMPAQGTASVPDSLRLG